MSFSCLNVDLQTLCGSDCRTNVAEHIGGKLRVYHGYGQKIVQNLSDQHPCDRIKDRVWVLRAAFCNLCRSRSQKMLSLFGVQSPDWRVMAFAMFWSTAAAIGLVALWLFGRWKREDPVQRAWSTFCARMARAGFPRSRSEGPLAFAERSGRLLPQRADLIRNIASLYANLRYGRNRDPGESRQLRELVSRFRPR